MGKQNIITREILILHMCLIDQNVIIFLCRTNFREDPARPGPARPRRFLTAYLSNVFEYTNLILLQNVDTGPKIAILYFHRDFFISSEVIAFFARTDFFHFFEDFGV